MLWFQPCLDLKNVTHTSHLLREWFMHQAQCRPGMGTGGAFGEECWLSHWRCDTVQTGTKDSRGQGLHTRGNIKSQLTTQGVSGLPDPGLFLFLVLWLFRMECVNAVMPNSATSRTRALIMRIFKTWVVLSLSKTAIMAAICGKPNPPVCLELTACPCRTRPCFLWFLSRNLAPCH